MNKSEKSLNYTVITKNKKNKKNRFSVSESGDRFFFLSLLS